MEEPNINFQLLSRTKNGNNAYQEVQTLQYPGFVWVVNVCTGYQVIVGSAALIPQVTHTCQNAEPGFTFIQTPVGWWLALDPCGGNYNNSSVRWYPVTACPFCGERLE